MICDFRPTNIKTDSRFGIGESFRKPAEVETPKIEETQKVDEQKHCKICNISVTSESQMELHLRGAKHAKKLKLAGKIIPLETIQYFISSFHYRDTAICFDG